jgi:hypothetical protein
MLLAVCSGPFTYCHLPSACNSEVINFTPHMCHFCVTCARESSGHPASSQHLLDITDVPRLCDLGSKYDIRMNEKLSSKKKKL